MSEICKNGTKAKLEAVETGFRRMIHDDCEGKPQKDWNECKVCWFKEYCELRRASKMTMDKRDLAADLAICEATTPGPWSYDPEEKDEDGVSMLSGIWAKTGCVAEFDEEPSIVNAEFIAAAREGWPHAIRRAMAAEERWTRAVQVLKDLEKQLTDGPTRTNIKSLLQEAEDDG